MSAQDFRGGESIGLKDRPNRKMTGITNSRNAMTVILISVIFVAELSLVVNSFTNHRMPGLDAPKSMAQKKHRLYVGTTPDSDPMLEDRSRTFHSLSFFSPPPRTHSQKKLTTWMDTLVEGGRKNLQGMVSQSHKEASDFAKNISNQGTRNIRGARSRPQVKKKITDAGKRKSQDKKQHENQIWAFAGDVAGAAKQSLQQTMTGALPAVNKNAAKGVQKKAREREDSLVANIFDAWNHKDVQTEDAMKTVDRKGQTERAKLTPLDKWFGAWNRGHVEVDVNAAKKVDKEGGTQHAVENPIDMFFSAWRSGESDSKVERVQSVEATPVASVFGAWNREDEQKSADKQEEKYVPTFVDKLLGAARQSLQDAAMGTVTQKLTLDQKTVGRSKKEERDMTTQSEIHASTFAKNILQLLDALSEPQRGVWAFQGRLVDEGKKKLKGIVSDSRRHVSSIVERTLTDNKENIQNAMKGPQNELAAFRERLVADGKEKIEELASESRRQGLDFIETTLTGGENTLRKTITETQIGIPILEKKSVEGSSIKTQNVRSETNRPQFQKQSPAFVDALVGAARQTLQDSAMAGLSGAASAARMGVDIASEMVSKKREMQAKAAPVTRLNSGDVEASSKAELTNSAAGKEMSITREKTFDRGPKKPAQGMMSQFERQMSTLVDKGGSKTAKGTLLRTQVKTSSLRGKIEDGRTKKLQDKISEDVLAEPQKPTSAFVDDLVGSAWQSLQDAVPSVTSTAQPNVDNPVPVETNNKKRKMPTFRASPVTKSKSSSNPILESSESSKVGLRDATMGRQEGISTLTTTTTRMERGNNGKSALSRSKRQISTVSVEDAKKKRQGAVPRHEEIFTGMQGNTANSRKKEVQDVKPEVSSTLHEKHTSAFVDDMVGSAWKTLEDAVAFVEAMNQKREMQSIKDISVANLSRREAQTASTQLSSKRAVNVAVFSEVERRDARGGPKDGSSRVKQTEKKPQFMKSQTERQVASFVKNILKDGKMNSPEAAMGPKKESPGFNGNMASGVDVKPQDKLSKPNYPQPKKPISAFVDDMVGAATQSLHGAMKGAVQGGKRSAFSVVHPSVWRTTALLLKPPKALMVEGQAWQTTNAEPTLALSPSSYLAPNGMSRATSVLEKPAHSSPWAKGEESSAGLRRGSGETSVAEKPIPASSRVHRPRSKTAKRKVVPRPRNPVTASDNNSQIQDIWETSAPETVHGGSLRTWSFASPYVERVQVLLKTEGRPLNADVELWQGPDNSPQKMRIYSEDGNLRPFSAVIETPRGSSSVAVRNTNPISFPLDACVVEAVDAPPGLGAVTTSQSCTSMPRAIQGGAVQTYPLAAFVESVKVLVKTDGLPLNARIELLQGPNNNKKVFELYTEDGLERPFFALIETPGAGNVIRIVNTGPVEFPVMACVEPHLVVPGSDETGGYIEIGPTGTK